MAPSPSSTEQQEQQEQQAAATRVQAAQRGPDPIERALALLEKAQAAAAHQRT